MSALTERMKALIEAHDLGYLSDVDLAKLMKDEGEKDMKGIHVDDSFEPACLDEHSTDTEFDDEFSEYLSTKEDWTREMKCIDGILQPVWIPATRGCIPNGSIIECESSEEAEKLSEYERFVTGEIDRILIKDHPAFEEIKRKLNDGTITLGGAMGLAKSDIYSGSILRPTGFSSSENND